MDKTRIENMITNAPWALNRMAEIVCYKWPVETVRRELKESLDNFADELIKDGGFEFDKIGELDGTLLYDMGFRVWCEMGEGDLWCFPLWMFNYIPKGMKLTCIFGDTVEFDPETIDKDTRFGCIAYGLVLPKEKYQQLKKRHEERKAKKELDNEEGV